MSVPETGVEAALQEKAKSRSISSFGKPTFAPVPTSGNASNADDATEQHDRATSAPRRENAAAPAEAAPSAPTRTRTDSIREREEKRLAGSVHDTRSESAVRWFVANEDGSYKKWQAKDLEIAIRGGLISPETLLWRKGMDGWVAADESAEWRQLYEGRQGGRSSSPGSAATTEGQPPHGTSPEEQSTAASVEPAQAGAHINEPLGRQDAHQRAGADAADKAAARPDPEVATAERAQPSLADHKQSPAEQAAAAYVEATGERRPLVDDDQETQGDGSVAGSKPTTANQKAVSMPLVEQHPEEPDARAAERQQGQQRLSRSSHSGLRRHSSSFRAADRATGTPVDSGAELDGPNSGHWAPATDTYTGPRGPHTHRIGSEGERARLLQQVEREQRLMRSLRNWQWIAIGTAATAIVAFMLAFYALLSWQQASTEAVKCQTSGAEP